MGHQINIEKALIVLVDEKITFVEKKSQFQSNKKKKIQIQLKKKPQIKATILFECI